MRRTLARLLLVPGMAIGVVGLAAAPALAAPSQQDTTWMVEAHQSNLTEIAAGTDAQQKATTAEVKQLGAMFVQMHTELDQQLTAAAQQLGVQLPDAPSPAQQAQLQAVQQNSGQAYDNAWIAQQIGSHTTTLAATQRELSNGSDPTVLALAQASTPVVQQHLTELRNTADQFGIPSSVPGGTGGQAADDGTAGLGWALAGTGALAALVGGTALVRRRNASA
jgi:putative membrane protein